MHQLFAGSAHVEAGRVSVVLIVLLGACIDYSPQRVVGPAPEPTLVVTIPDEYPPEEVCNGLDDDGDLEVDEGFPDTDGDGVRDCVDSECSVDLSEAVALDDPYSCITGGVTVSGEIGLEEVWAYRWDGSDPKGCTGLVAADLEGDGRVELVCAGVEGPIVVFDGPTGARLRSFGDASGDLGVAALDSDADGVVELYTVGEYAELRAYRGDSGAPLLTSADMYGFGFGGAAGLGAILRMGARGGPPALVGAMTVTSLRDGSTLAAFELVGNPAVEPLAADVDFDGLPDILMAGSRFDQFGGVVFEPTESSSSNARYTRAFQADGDPDGEVLFSSADGWEVVEPDGTQLSTGGWPTAVVWSGPPCTAMDASGNRSFVTQTVPYVQSRNLSGAVQWTVEVQDSSEAEGCIAFDFTGDGNDDVAFLDQFTLRIVDGQSGQVVASASAPNVTANDGLMVVDLEGDGSIELIMHGSSDRSGSESDPGIVVPVDIIKVFRVTGITADIANHWPIESWTGTELNPDLTIPRTQRPSWLTTCASPAQPEVRQWGSDVVPIVVDSCTAGCENGPVTLSIAVQNWGPLELNTGTSVAIYREADGALLGVAVNGNWIDDATASEGVAFSVSLEDAQAGLVLVAGDDGSGQVSADDPNPANNTLSWRFDPCD